MNEYIEAIRRESRQATLSWLAELLTLAVDSGADGTLVNAIAKAWRKKA